MYPCFRFLLSYYLFLLYWQVLFYSHTLRLVELTVVDFCWTVVVFIPALCPAALLFSGLLTTVVDDLLVVTLPFPLDLFTVVLFVTVAGDFLVVPEFLLY